MCTAYLYTVACIVCMLHSMDQFKSESKVYIMLLVVLSIITSVLQVSLPKRWLIVFGGYEVAKLFPKQKFLIQEFSGKENSEAYTSESPDTE